MQIGGLEKIQSQQFHELNSELRRTREEKNSLLQKLNRLKKYGISSEDKRREIESEVTPLDDKIIKLKISIRSLLPEGQLESTVDEFSQISVKLMRSLEIFCAWNQESYLSGTTSEFLQKRFEKDNLQLIAEYRFLQQKLLNKYFAFDLTDFSEIDELVKLVNNYNQPLPNMQGFNDFIAEMCLRISTNSPTNAESENNSRKVVEES